MRLIRVIQNIYITQVSNMGKDFLEQAFFGFEFTGSCLGLIMGIYLN